MLEFYSLHPKPLNCTTHLKYIYKCTTQEFICTYKATIGFFNNPNLRIWYSHKIQSFVIKLVHLVRLECFVQKSLGSSPVASSPSWWTIYKSNISPFWDLQLVLTLIQSSLLSSKLSFTKKKKNTILFTEEFQCALSSSISRIFQ